SKRDWSSDVCSCDLSPSSFFIGILCLTVRFLPNWVKYIFFIIIDSKFIKGFKIFFLKSFLIMMFLLILYISDDIGQLRLCIRERSEESRVGRECRAS